MKTTQTFQPSQAIKEGWQGFSRNAVTLVGFSVISFVVMTLLLSLQAWLLTNGILAYGGNGGSELAALIVITIGISLLESITALIICLALLEGGLQSVRGQKISIKDMLAKFTEVPNMIGLQLFGGIAVALGFLTFVVPGIYLSVAYILAGLALVDGPKSFADALSLSRRLVTPHWFDVALFLLVVGSVILLGYLACLIGGFVSVPVGFCMMAAAYHQLLKLHPVDENGKQ